MSLTTLSNLPVCFLFDNGSLRPTATLSLRKTAAELAVILKVEVRAVSLLHSSAIDPIKLGGQPAELLEPALHAFLETNPGIHNIIFVCFGKDVFEHYRRVVDQLCPE